MRVIGPKAELESLYPHIRQYCDDNGYDVNDINELPEDDPLQTYGADPLFVFVVSVAGGMAANLAYDVLKQGVLKLIERYKAAHVQIDDEE